MTGNIHIEDSYKISKWDFDCTLRDIHWEALRGGYESKLIVFYNRSYFSLKMEWTVHNALYNLGIERERTKDVDLNYPQKLWEKILYPIGGILTWLFIK